MDYAMSNEGTKLPKAFKKAKAGKASGVARGKMLYMKAIKQAKRAGKGK